MFKLRDFIQQGSTVADKPARDALVHANMLQTNNVDAQCDTLATELS